MLHALAISSSDMTVLIVLGKYKSCNFLKPPKLISRWEQVTKEKYRKSFKKEERNEV
jgi:hypothetical protein